MTISLSHIILSIACFVSTAAVIVLIAYYRKVIGPILIASEESTELFTRLDAYEKHLNSVYELPTFYGDDTLKMLLNHTKEMCLYLQRYEDIYSFTQPNLLEILEKIDDEYDQEAQAQEEE